MCLPSVRTGVEGGVAAGDLLETELAGASILLTDVVPSLCSSLGAEDLPLRWGNGQCQAHQGHGGQTAEGKVMPPSLNFPRENLFYSLKNNKS